MTVGQDGDAVCQMLKISCLVQSVGTVAEDGNIFLAEEEAVADGAVAYTLALQLDKTGKVERNILAAGSQNKCFCLQLLGHIF